MTFNLQRVKKGRFPGQFKQNDDQVIREFADMIITRLRLADCILDLTKLHNDRLDQKKINGVKVERELLSQEFFQLIKGKRILHIHKIK